MTGITSVLTANVCQLFPVGDSACSLPVPAGTAPCFVRGLLLLSPTLALNPTTDSKRGAQKHR